MPIDKNKLRQKLDSLSNNKKSNCIWKPAVGKHAIRIIPNKNSPDWPFVELKFHYGLNNKTYLSPATFGRPDPILEFALKLQKTGEKEDWKAGKKLEPKVRTFVPVIVRGSEAEGVKWWGFSRTTFNEILSIMNDDEVGDIMDLEKGRDINVEITQIPGKEYPETSVRVKINTSPAVDPNNKQLVDKLIDQIDIHTQFTEPTYDELKEAMEISLSGAPDQTSDTPSNATSSTASDTTSVVVTSPSGQAATETPDDVAKVFSDLFKAKKTA